MRGVEQSGAILHLLSYYHTMSTDVSLFDGHFEMGYPTQEPTSFNFGDLTLISTISLPIYSPIQAELYTSGIDQKKRIIYQPIHSLSLLQRRYRLFGGTMFGLARGEANTSCV